jgi:multidrug resistance efflux pump
LPIGDEIGALAADPGEVISLGQAVMTLKAERKLWYGFAIREDFLGGLAIGSPAQLRTARGDAVKAVVATWRIRDMEPGTRRGDHDRS